MYVEDYIKMEDMKDGYLYKIIARNAAYGIWNSVTQSFAISRIKFHDNFIFEECHYDCPEWATAQPVEEVEKSPFCSKELNADAVETEVGDYKYWRIENERAMLEYLNKFEKDRSYQWPRIKDM